MIFASANSGNMSDYLQEIEVDEYELDACDCGSAVTMQSCVKTELHTFRSGRTVADMVDWCHVHCPECGDTINFTTPEEAQKAWNEARQGGETKSESEKMLDLALAQFTGFGLASRGHSIQALIESMGLSKEEFKQLQTKIKPLVKELDFKFLNEYFRRN